MLIKLSLKSLLNRWLTVALTLLSITLSVALLLSVEKVRNDAKASFANTISQTDLVVGARSGSVQLLLYSVFHIGHASNNIRWSSYQEISNHRLVAWSVPISLGDSHRGFPVMGTTNNFFTRYQYGQKQHLQMAQGTEFDDLYEAVIGADIANKLGYRIGQEIVLAHGMVDIGTSAHADKPFRVSGILARTGTPVDRTIHIKLEGLEAMHLDWQAGVPIPGRSISSEQARAMDLTPKAITAFMLGLKSKIGAFQLQRTINNYRKEPLQAILPGVALQELWDLMSLAERALTAITLLVLATSLVGILVAILSTLSERRREMAILRTIGARPYQIFLLFTAESFFYGVAGSLLGYLLYSVALMLGASWLLDTFGLNIAWSLPAEQQLLMLISVPFAAGLMGLLPATLAYRHALSDGLTSRQ